MTPTANTQVGRRFSRWGLIVLGAVLAYLVAAYVILPRLGKERAQRHPDRADGARLTHTANDRASFLQLAAEQCTNESDALFFCETSRLFAQLQTGGSALARLEAFGSLPVGLGTEGNAYVALEWDYAAWTEHAAAFITRLKSAQFQGKTPTNVVVALSGVASPMVQQKLDDAGIVLVARLAPGPLQ